MLIISKFHDYYDTVIKSAGVDKSIVFNRTERKVVFEWPRNKSGFVSHSFPHRDYQHISEYYRRKDEVGFGCFAVGFCGKTYCGIKIGQTHIYGDDAFAWIDEENKKGRWGDWEMENKIPYWKEFKFPMEMFRNYNSPILLLNAPEFNDLDRNQLDSISHTLRFGKYLSLRINPVLKDCEFHKVIDAFTAFQEIQMFVSGVLGKTEKETVKISDNNKIVEHGFDPKWSFRKPSKVTKNNFQKRDDALTF